MFIALFVFGTIFTAAVIAAVLPRLVVYARMGGYVCRDRGIRKGNTSKGSLIVCEPAPADRSVLQQFALERTEAGTVFLAKWAKHVRYVEYDLYVYDRRGKGIKVLSVRELPIAGKGSKVALPRDTGFVSPAIRAVDHAPRKDRTDLLPFFRSLYVVLFLTGMLFWQALFSEVCFSHLFFEGKFFLKEGASGFLVSMFFLSAAIVFAAVFALFGAKPLLLRLRAGRKKKVEAAPPRLGAVRCFFLRLKYAVQDFFIGLKTSAPVLALRKKLRNLRDVLSNFFRGLRPKGGKA